MSISRLGIHSNGSLSAGARLAAATSGVNQNLEGFFGKVGEVLNCFLCDSVFTRERTRRICKQSCFKLRENERAVQTGIRFPPIVGKGCGKTEREIKTSLSKSCAKEL